MTRPCPTLMTIKSFSFDVFKSHVFREQTDHVTEAHCKSECQCTCQKFTQISILLRHIEFMFSTKLEYRAAVKL